MAVTVDSRNTGAVTSVAGALTLAWNHTVGGGATMLIVSDALQTPGAEAIAGVAWDAAVTPVALAKLGGTFDGGGTSASDLWGLVAPASGTKQIKVTSNTAGTVMMGGSASYAGVNTATPLNAASPQSVSAFGGTGDLLVTSAIGELVVVALADSGASATITPTAGQTQISNQHVSGTFGVSSDAPGAATVATSHSGIAGADAWGSVGVSLAAAVVPVPVLSRRRPTIPRDRRYRALRTLGAYATYLPGPVSTVLTTDVGALVVTGFAPTVTVSNNVTLATDVGALVVTGLAPTVTVAANVTLVTATGALIVTGLAPTVSVGTVLATGAGALVVTGLAPTVAVSANIVLATGTGALVLTGLAPAVTVGVVLATATGALVVTGLAPTVAVSANVTLVTGVGALVVTGLAPTVTVSNNIALTTDVGALVLTGLAPAVTVGVTLATDVGALVVTGFAPDVTVTANVVLVTDVGALVLTGYAPTVDGGVAVVPPFDSGGGYGSIRTGGRGASGHGATTDTGWRKRVLGYIDAALDEPELEPEPESYPAKKAPRVPEKRKSAAPVAVTKAELLPPQAVTPVELPVRAAMLPAELPAQALSPALAPFALETTAPARRRPIAAVAPVSIGARALVVGQVTRASLGPVTARGGARPPAPADAARPVRLGRVTALAFHNPSDDALAGLSFPSLLEF